MGPRIRNIIFRNNNNCARTVDDYYYHNGNTVLDYYNIFIEIKLPSGIPGRPRASIYL